MYVRDAKKREEVWLLDRIEEMGLDDPAFRSRDYVIAEDEQDGRKVGFGRIRIHKGEGDPACELTAVGTLASWRRQGVAAHVVERLTEKSRDEGFDDLYAMTSETSYLRQFGFATIDAADLPANLRPRLEEIRESVDPEAVPMVVAVDEFQMPRRLRERFKDAGEQAEEDAEPEERPEDFGIDPNSATYKYDTGRRR
ncbi:GNAT family N-acetyltransferase [Halobacteriaceae archaeon GCM10025711]